MKLLLQFLILAMVCNPMLLVAQNVEKKWIFVEKDGKEIPYKQGQNIAVKWRGLSGIKTSKGILGDITADSLRMLFKKKEISFAQKDIVALSTKHTTTLNILCSFFLSIGVILIWGFISHFKLSQLRSGGHLGWGTLLGVGLIVIGILINNSSTSIRDPFSDQWQLKEKTTEIKNMP